MKYLIPLFLMSFNVLAADYQPLTVPENVIVLPSEARKTVWASLSKNEKKLATHLLNAANAGKTILYYSGHRHGLLVKQMIETSLNQKNIESTKKLLGENGFKEYLNYAAKFFDQYGVYAPANRKYVLSVVTAGQIKELFQLTSPKENEANVIEAVKLLTDPTFEVISKPESPDGKDLEISGGNFYQHGLTGAEVTAALNGGFKSNLNCRIVRTADKKVACEVQALNNPNLDPIIRSALTKVVTELKSAAKYASTVHQKNQINHLITYFYTGDIEEFRKMNIEWVKDETSSKVDFMMGYVEVYQDYLNQIGSWESYVQIIDPKMTEFSVNLAKNAQSFEDRMPYGIYKKKFPENYSPPALIVYYFQEHADFRSGGYNLPNFDDIRRDVGAKNIIRTDLPGMENDPAILKMRREKYEEFLPANKVDGVMNDWLKIRRLIVTLHEIIGHGSGTYDTKKYGEKEDPIGALGALGGSLEEQRADLTALVFGADPILVKVGFFQDEAEALRVRNTMYDGYLADLLQNISKQQTLSQAHQRGRWLLVNMLMEKGIVKKVSRDGSKMTNENFVLAVTDHQKFHQACVELLAELQRIKATRDEKALKTLYSKHAPLDEIKKPWLQAVIQRGKKLAVNAGAIDQPWEISNGNVNVLGTVSLEGIAPYIGR
jgi:dipeptidyl-peptidase-3